MYDAFMVRMVVMEKEEFARKIERETLARVAVQHHQSLGIEHQVRSTQNHLLLVLVEAANFKPEFPSHKALHALAHALGDDKTRLYQTHKHVGKDAGDLCKTSHAVEWIFEACLGRVVAVQLRQTLRRQVFKIRQHCVDGVCGCVACSVHKTAFRTRKKYQRLGMTRSAFIHQVKRLGK